MWLWAYSVVGLVLVLFVLVVCWKARRDVENGTARRYKREFHELMDPPQMKLFIVGFAFFLWPVLVMMWIWLIMIDNADDDNNDPQDRVPPKYR